MASAPEPLVRVAALMSSFRSDWFLCGGWAVDSWLGRQTRDHPDVDIAVFHDDQRAIFEHLEGWQLVAHDPQVPGDTTERWDGRRLELPAHIHARYGDAASVNPETGRGPGFNLEVLLNERSGRDWIFSREPRVRMPLDRSAQRSAWGLPTVVPSVLLFYKATAYFADEEMKNRRQQDEPDFVALLPRVGEEQRDWLREAISLVYPGHPWLAELSR